MLKRQDMESQKATAGALWSHHTRTYIPFTSAMSPCPPASLSSRSSPWQNPRGSRPCSGTPSINSPLSRNENGCRASTDVAVKRTFCFFCAHSKDSVDPVLKTSLRDEKGEALDSPRSCCLGRGKMAVTHSFRGHKNPLWPVPRWPRPGTSDMV